MSLAGAVAVLVALLWAVASHVALAQPAVGLLAPLLLSLPLLLAAWLPTRRSRWRGWVVVGVVLWLGVLAVGSSMAGALAYGVAVVQHVAAYAALAVWFGASLRAGATPIATRVAAAVLPDLPLRVRHYCRWATAGWTAFFAAVAVLSLTLAAVGASATWRLFALWVSPALVAALFAFEFWLRGRCVPAAYRATLAQTVLGFRALLRSPPPDMARTRWS